MAASKMKFLLFVFFLISALSFTTKASREDSGDEVNNVSGIVTALEEKGYKAMSSILKNSLTSLLSNQNYSTSFTIFCPTDIAFAGLRKVQPPPTFLAYHVTPYYLVRDDLELRTGTLRLYSGIKTLLPGNSLVSTSQVPHLNSKSDFEAELNFVKIIDWNIYNDGNIIVHGIQGFFNPSAQAILLPWMEHHEIIKTTTESQSQEEGYFSTAKNLLSFLDFFCHSVLVVSGLIFLAYIVLMVALQMESPKSRVI